MLPSAEEFLRNTLAAAFPERGPMLFRELLRWFDDSRAARLPPEHRPPDDGARPCALCDRPSRYMLALVLVIPATKRRRVDYFMPGADGPASARPGSIGICSRCSSATTERIDEFGEDPQAWPNPDMVVAETRRALDLEGSQAAHSLLRDILDRSTRTAPRRSGTVTCDACSKRGVCIGGPRARLCFGCIRGAQRRFSRLRDVLASLRRR